MMWEMMNNGEDPWCRRSDFASDVILLKKEHLPRPMNCVDSVWHLMERCFEEDRERRPSFEEIHRDLCSLIPSLSDEPFFAPPVTTDC